LVRLCRERSLHWCLSLYGNPHNYARSVPCYYYCCCSLLFVSVSGKLVSTSVGTALPLRTIVLRLYAPSDSVLRRILTLSVGRNRDGIET
jgi:hypothetical protein